MEGFVVVRLYWGGEIIRNEHNIGYSIDAQKMLMVKLGSNFEDLKNVVFNAMGISPTAWKIRMKYKYPTIGYGSVICGHELYEINCDDDVMLLLGIPNRVMSGMGDVCVYVETDMVDTYQDAYVPFASQPTQYSVHTDFDPYNAGYQSSFPPSQFPEQGGGLWSDMFYGGSSSQPVHYDQGGASSHHNTFVEDFGGDNRMEFSPPSGGGGGGDMGRSLLVRHAEDENVEHDFGTDDSDYCLDSGEDDSEDDDSDSEQSSMHRQVQNPTPLSMSTGVHVPMAPWFEGEAYSPQEMIYPDEVNVNFNPERQELEKGHMFRDKQTLKDAVREMHIFSNRSYIVAKSNSEAYAVKCTVEGCPWKLRASKMKKHGMFEVTVCPARHTCLSVEPLQDHRKISIRLICKAVKPYVMNEFKYKINQVITLINDQYHHKISYNKAWRGKQLALEELFGNWKTTYADLPMFFAAVLHANRGSVALIEAEPSQDVPGVSTCKRIFLCLAAMIEGWKYARPVISIDATFLKGKYNGKLLVAMGVDANNHQYPICFALVDEESAENWGWFLKLLRKEVCKDRMDVCIISDRAAGIIAAMRTPANGFCPPYGTHRFCLYHLRSNFATKHPGGELKHLCWLAGSTTQVRKFEQCMKRIGEISTAALQYLNKIPPEKWALCYDGGSRYGQTTTNIVEGFNGSIVQARHLPVTAMMQYIFYRIVKIVNTHRNAVDDSLGRGENWCVRVSKLVAKYEEKANSHDVTCYHRAHGIFQIKTHRRVVRGEFKGGHVQNVDLRRRTCTCGKWTSNHFPCSHVIAACKAQNLHWKQWIGNEHCNSHVQMLWAPMILPLEPEQLWNYPLPPQWQRHGYLVPDERLRKLKKKKGGRGQSSARIRTEMDRSRTKKTCSRCLQEGHTRSSNRCPQRANRP